MIAAFLYYRQFFTIAISSLLILLIGCKVVAPVFKGSNLFVKEISLVTDSDEDKSEKKDNTDSYDKNKENINSYNIVLNRPLEDDWVMHSSFYTFDYKSSYYLKITSPPPDAVYTQILNNQAV